MTRDFASALAVSAFVGALVFIAAVATATI